MYDYMKSKGITNNYMSKSDVINTLERKNYYYKLTAFRKNSYKRDDRYINLDFSYLVDLASIDMQLRYLIMTMSLDIEHNIKTVLMRLITTNPEEDGFAIVKEFKQKCKYSYDKTLVTFSRSRYLEDMYQKRGQDIPVWTLVELMDFGSLCEFIKMYYEKYENKQLEKAYNLMVSAKYLRNSSAHSNILTINVFGSKNKINGQPRSVVSSLAIQMNIPRHQTKFKKLHDAICLFGLFNAYVSGHVRCLRKREGIRLLRRSPRHAEWYSNNNVLRDMYLVLYNLIDFL